MTLFSSHTSKLNQNSLIPRRGQEQILAADKLDLHAESWWLSKDLGGRQVEIDKKTLTAPEQHMAPSGVFLPALQ